MAFDMMAQMMALTSRMLGDFEGPMLTMGGADGAGLMPFGGMGGASQMMLISSGGGGGGFMMSAVQAIDPDDPSKNYSRTQTAQFGPGGVVEAREQVRDGRRQLEKIGLRRQLGDQYSQLERSRHMVTGEERSQRTVHNLEEDDAERFDERWMQAAQQSLPTYRRGGAPTLPTASQPLALPEPPSRRSIARETPPRTRPAAAPLPARHSRLVPAIEYDRPPHASYVRQPAIPSSRQAYYQPQPQAPPYATYAPSSYSYSRPAYF